MQSMLPNVYQELHECLFYGARLVVKNTFVDLDDAGSTESLSKTKSLPIFPSLRQLLEDDEGEATPSAKKSLNEVRTRVFSESCQRDVRFHLDCDTACSEASTRAPLSSSAGDACSRLPSLREHSQEPSTTFVDAQGSELSCATARGTQEEAGSHEEAGSPEEQGTTTFMIRSLPREMTRAKLEQLLDAEGFAKQYDFLYLPANLKIKGCYGYGFVNLVSAAAATRFVKHLSGYTWPDQSQEPMGVHKSEALEGLDALVNRYRNSPLMHEAVPEEVRPAIYCDGAKVPFPSPTVELRAPRMRSLPGQRA